MPINSLALAKKSLNSIMEYSNDEPHVVVEAGNLRGHLGRIANYIRGQERRIKVLEDQIKKYETGVRRTFNTDDPNPDILY